MLEKSIFFISPFFCVYFAWEEGIYFNYVSFYHNVYEGAYAILWLKWKC